MSQSKQSDCGLSDASKVYTTEGIIEQFQHCVIFNLRDSGIFANVCILWRRKTSFNTKEIQRVNRFLNQYKHKHNIKEGSSITFTICENESNVRVINGELYRIILYLRQQCVGMVKLEKQPLPFIKPFQLNHIKHIHPHKIIDERTQYETKANVCIVGRSIAIDLNDSSVPGNKDKKHMTVFYRKSGWNEGEVKKMTQIKDKWMKENEKRNVTFTLIKWKGGSHSANIKGDLFTLCWYLRNECKRMCTDQQPVPHVAMWQ
eukprot:159753_1